jgi:hypothetical protein
MPLYHGHVPVGQSVRQLEENCCPVRHCTQRNYNRVVLLTLEKLSQAYAALLLTRHAAQRLWNCHSTGHADNCQDPACTFGRAIDVQYATNQADFGVYARSFCSILARCATDLTPQWQDFTDTEQFYIGLTYTAPNAQDTELDIKAEYLAALQDAAVLSDPVEYQRWFGVPGEPA